MLRMRSSCITRPQLLCTLPAPYSNLSSLATSFWHFVPRRIASHPISRSALHHIANTAPSLETLLHTARKLP